VPCAFVELWRHHQSPLPGLSRLVVMLWDVTSSLSSRCIVYAFEMHLWLRAVSSMVYSLSDTSLRDLPSCWLYLWHHLLRVMMGRTSSLKGMSSLNLVPKKESFTESFRLLGGGGNQSRNLQVLCKHDLVL
jgi:hypothetical protein